MGSSLLEFISNSTFVDKCHPANDVIANAPLSHIFDFCRETVELTNANNLTPETSIFTHSASIQLGGGRFPCQGIDCRLKQINELAQFAALYSEKVYVKNIFSDHLLEANEKNLDEFRLKKAFADDLQIYISLIPLIEAGVIVPITAHSDIHSLSKSKFSNLEKERLSQAYKSLTVKIRGHIQLSISKKNNAYCMRHDTQNTVLDHPGFFYFKKCPSFLTVRPHLLSRVDSGETVTLSTKVSKDSEFSEYLAGELMESIIFELTLSQCLKTSFLINREIDQEFLRFLTTDKQIRDLDNVIEKNLTALVPFLNNVEPSALIKLRKADEDSFILFRNTLRKVVAEYTNKSGVRISKDDARAIYGDILQPELTRLTKKLEKAKSTLVRSTGSTIVGWTAAISVGAFTGLVTGGIVEAATALGLTKVLASLTEKVSCNSDIQSAIRDDELYFLWKVKRESEQ